jgi:hypothetical protein
MTGHLTLTGRDIVTIIMPSLVTMIIWFIGMFIGLKKNKNRAAERVRWRERYRISPEANLLRLND